MISCTKVHYPYILRNSTRCIRRVRNKFLLDEGRKQELEGSLRELMRALASKGCVAAIATMARESGKFSSSVMEGGWPEVGRNELAVV